MSGAGRPGTSLPLPLPQPQPQGQPSALARGSHWQLPGPQTAWSVVAVSLSGLHGTLRRREGGELRPSLGAPGTTGCQKGARRGPYHSMTMSRQRLLRCMFSYTSRMRTMWGPPDACQCCSTSCRALGLSYRTWGQHRPRQARGSLDRAAAHTPLRREGREAQGGLGPAPGAQLTEDKARM